MTTNKSPRSWVKDLLIAFAATTLSILLTFGTSALIDLHRKKADRKLTAMMVMASIEEFIFDMEKLDGIMAHLDSVCTWALSLPFESAARLNDEQAGELMNELYVVYYLTHDKTAENVFSSHIDTWKNMGNFLFIDNAGQTFSQMNFFEEFYNNAMAEYQEAYKNITTRPDDYPGSTTLEKTLRNEQVRQQMLMPKKIRDWAYYAASEIRKFNQNNMLLMGISEKEVKDFMVKKESVDSLETEQIDNNIFRYPSLNADSVALTLPVARQIDSILFPESRKPL